MSIISLVESPPTSSPVPAQCNTFSFTGFFREKESIISNQSGEKRNFLERSTTLRPLRASTSVVQPSTHRGYLCGPRTDPPSPLSPGAGP